MRELFGILASLVQPALGFLRGLVTGAFGVRPLLFLLAQAGLQFVVVTAFYDLGLVAASILTAVLTLGLASAAFAVFSIGLGMAFENDSKFQHLSKDAAERRYWNTYAVTGFVVASVVALLTSGATLGLTSYFQSTSLVTTLVAVALSAICGAFLSTAGVVGSMRRATINVPEPTNE